MSCCRNAMWKHRVASGGLSQAELRAASVAGARRSAPAIGPVDTILLDATFLLATPTRGGERVTAVALSGDTIVDVGDAERIIASAPGARRVSHRGSVLAPGFIEAHAHIIAATSTTYSVDLRGLAGYPQVIDRITDAVAGAASDAWLFFINFDPSLLGWSDEGFPQLGFEQFDAIAGADNVNIFVENASGHIAYANRRAFATCGITAKTPPPAQGGHYGVDGDQLTGVMFEPPTFSPFLDHAPKASLEHLLAAMREFLATAQAAGITTVADPSVGIGGDLAAELLLYDLLAGAPGMPTDVVGSLDLTSVYPPGSSDPSSRRPKGLTMPSAPGGTGSFGSLIIPAVKLWADGSTQGYTAYLSAPYLEPVTPPGLGPRGEPDWQQEEMNALLAAARADHWSVLIHANGDAGLTMALDAIKAVYGADSGYRNRIEHCTVTTADQYDTMRALGVTPSYLNNHIYIWGDVFADHIIGPERAARLDCASEARDRGMIFSFHCDYATTLPGPLRYMQTAVTRETSSGRALGPEYALTAEEALAGVTIHAARQLGIDGLVGTIERGKLANLVNLADDPTTAAPDQIAAIPVLGTYLRGAWMPVIAATTLESPSAH